MLTLSSKNFLRALILRSHKVKTGTDKRPFPKKRPIKPSDGVDWKKELGAYRLILGYRNKGHLIAKTNPIRPRKDRGANLDLGFFGFTEEDLDKSFFAGNLIGLGTTTLRNILGHLQKCYANHVGIEFKYISDQIKIDWLTTEMEKKFIEPTATSKKTTDTRKTE